MGLGGLCGVCGGLWGWACVLDLCGGSVGMCVGSEVGRGGQEWRAGVCQGCVLCSSISVSAKPSLLYKANIRWHQERQQRQQRHQ